MGYLIFTHEQITPATLIRPRLEGGQTEVENPARPTLPAGEVIYLPPNYNRFSVNAADRMILIKCDNGSATTAEIYAAFPLYSTSLMDVIRQQSQEHILATYPVWYQSNVALGIYGQPIADKLRDDIAAVITECNRCEQLIYDGKPYTLNLPVIGG